MCTHVLDEEMLPSIVSLERNRLRALSRSTCISLDPSILTLDHAVLIYPQNTGGGRGGYDGEEIASKHTHTRHCFFLFQEEVQCPKEQGLPR